MNSIMDNRNDTAHFVHAALTEKHRKIVVEIRLANLAVNKAMWKFDSELAKKEIKRMNIADEERMKIEEEMISSYFHILQQKYKLNP